MTIEIEGAKLLFYGPTSHNESPVEFSPLASMQVPIRLEHYGSVKLVIDAWQIPPAAREATHFRISLPMPVLYEARELSIMLSSDVIEISPTTLPGMFEKGGEG